MIRIEINKNNNKPSVNRSHNQNIQKEELIEYRGEVFCLQVPSEIFYVRKNGKGVWTGNSRSRGPKTLLTHQAPEGLRLQMHLEMHPRLHLYRLSKEILYF